MEHLKTLYDAAKAAEGRMQAIMKEMIAAFEAGTEEGKAKALELRPALDEAKKEAEDANRLYISAREADAEDADAAVRYFVPVGEETVSAKKEMSRAEFEKLSAKEQMSFMLADGRLTDN